MCKYYVYYLKDGDETFYVGKGSNDRMYKHVKYVKKGLKLTNNQNLYDKIISILNEDREIVYEKIFETNDELEAYDFENNEINRIGLKNLCNLISGSYFKENLSERVKEGLKKSKKFKKSFKSKERIEKLRLANLGKKNPQFGKKLPKWRIDQIREVNSKPKSESHRKNISESLKKHVKSESHRKNISESLKKSKKFQEKVKSGEYRKKHSLLSRGKNNSNAKTFIFISPNNEEFKITGAMENFIKENKINRNKILQVRKGLIPEWNGWCMYELKTSLT
jgi:hypothetical protein